MNNKLEQFYRYIQGKKVAILGIGVSNSGLFDMLSAHGARVIACDRKERDTITQEAQKLEDRGIELRLGEGYLERLEADIVFRTPGMHFLGGEIQKLRERGMIVTSEMEVFFDLCPCTTIAVTGSDGKTTTTTLIAEMLKAQGRKVHLGGNIGRALLPLIETIAPDDVAVVELSSFQLISMRRSPDIAVLTNLAPNHLDVHKDMAEYIGAKKNIFAHQNAFGITVLNADNPPTIALKQELRSICRTFSLKQPVQNGVYLAQNSDILLAKNGHVQKIMNASDIRLPGIHNIANYLAAISAVSEMVGFDTISKVAREFGGVEHRIEFVRELDGVKWYNDSIATSPSRAIAGLLSFDRKLILIAGGYDKKIPFEPLAPHIIERVKTLILTGDTSDKIEAAVRAHADYHEGCPKILHADHLEDAVKLARQMALSGDIVSMSPACASFDRYPNFEARGRHFKTLVSAL